MPWICNVWPVKQKVQAFSCMGLITAQLKLFKRGAQDNFHLQSIHETLSLQNRSCESHFTLLVGPLLGDSAFHPLRGFHEKNQKYFYSIYIRAFFLSRFGSMMAQKNSKMISHAHNFPAGFFNLRTRGISRMSDYRR